MRVVPLDKIWHYFARDVGADSLWDWALLQVKNFDAVRNAVHVRKKHIENCKKQRNRKRQVKAICSDPSLTTAQFCAKLREIK